MTVSAEIDDLIGRVARQDRRAFARLYDVTSAQVYGVICAILPDQDAAQTALQATFVRVWQIADRFAESGLGPMTWLIGLARNFAVDRLQRSGDATQVDDDLVAQIYWRGDKYDALALAKGISEGEMRLRLDDALTELQARLAP